MSILPQIMRFIPVVNWAANSSVTAQENTAHLVALVLKENIPGDLVECGVYAGAHCALMAKGLMLAGETERHVHLFDSFQGIPEAGPNDDTWPGIGERPGVERTGRLKSTGISACSRAGVEFNMARWGIDRNLLVYHEGWFQETLPSPDPMRIALLRLDADLYESTMVCLKHLYPCVSQSGFVIIDDWNLKGAQQAVLDYFANEGGPPVYNVELGGQPMWWQKP